MSLNVYLKRLGQRVKSAHPFINYGGCCVFAALAGRALLKRGIKCKVIVTASDAYQHLDIVKAQLADTGDVEEWNRNDVWFNHVALEFERNGKIYHYDTDGVVAAADNYFKGGEIYPGRLSIKEATALASRQAGWNCAFNRKQIPTLHRTITHFFNKTMPKQIGRQQG